VITCSTVLMIVGPPGLPIAKSSFHPSHDRRRHRRQRRFFGAIAFASP
jgi:hypothetical protein